MLGKGKRKKELIEQERVSSHGNNALYSQACIPGTNKENCGCFCVCHFRARSHQFNQTRAATELWYGLEANLSPAEAARICTQLLQASEWGLQALTNYKLKPTSFSFRAKLEVTHIMPLQDILRVLTLSNNAHHQGYLIVLSQGKYQNPSEISKEKNYLGNWRIN